METETTIVNQDGVTEEDMYHTWGEVAEYYGLDLFIDSESERFVRLVVRDHEDRREYDSGRLYDSHIGIPGLPRNHYFVPEFGASAYGASYNVGSELYLLTHTRIPVDFDEWYFIVASYDPTINEDGSFDLATDECPTTTIFHPNYRRQLLFSHIFERVRFHKKQSIYLF